MLVDCLFIFWLTSDVEIMYKNELQLSSNTLVIFNEVSNRCHFLMADIIVGDD